MTTYPAPECLFCTHYAHGGYRACAAYPQDGAIPDEYWYNARKHTILTDGYAFEQNPDLPTIGDDYFVEPPKETPSAAR